MGIFDKKKKAVDETHTEDVATGDKTQLSKADEAQAERNIRTPDTEG